MTIVNCVKCGKEFSIKPSAIKRGRGKYCSKECMYSGTFVVRKCEICGKETRIRNSHLAGRGNYCSVKCRSIGYIKSGIFRGENNPRYIDGKSTSKEYVCRKSHKRRALVVSNGGDYSIQEWVDLCEKYGNKCLCCGKTNVPLTVDHIIPLSKGGENNINNIQPLCKSCNSIKRDKVIDYREAVPS